MRDCLFVISTGSLITQSHPVTASTGDSGGTSNRLQFKHLRGFKIHGKFDGKPHVRTGSHRKIQSDASGVLRVTKKNYHTPQVAKPKDPNSIPNQSSAPFTLDTTSIPPCVDHLPDEVDLSILDDIPRQRTASVHFFCAHTGLNGFIPFHRIFHSLSGWNKIVTTFSMS